MDAPSRDDCPGRPGKVAPVVDRNRCEAKGDCVRVCPFDVFEVRALAARDRAALSFVCIDACPEHALGLAAWRP